jgi:hypothetical protein
MGIVFSWFVTLGIATVPVTLVDRLNKFYGKNPVWNAINHPTSITDLIFPV